MAERLIIDYITSGNGYQRGYNFVTPTDHLPSAVKKLLWRAAMPRGTKWAAYIGARSLKSIPLPNGQIALAMTTVTDRQDEIGRGGLRRAEIQLIPAREYRLALQRHLAQLPASAHQRADAMLSWRLWKRIADKALPKVNREAQIILAHAYSTMEDWLALEALVLKIALARPVNLLARWGARPTFTTLALDYREESRIVALPIERANRYHDRKDAFILKLP